MGPSRIVTAFFLAVLEFTYTQTVQVCDNVLGQTFLPDFDDCTKYHLCTPQKDWTLFCGAGMAWNQETTQCVNKGSINDTCSNISLQNYKQKVFIEKLKLSFPSLTQQLKAPLTSPNIQPAMDRWSSKFFCPPGATGKYPHPTKCAQFYDCSKTNSMEWWGQNLRECPYPEVFNELTKDCSSPSKVLCNIRQQPVDPCDYLKNQCRSANCIPCHIRHATCRGLPNGLHQWRGREMTSYFVVCQHERVIFHGRCQGTTPGQYLVFSPQQKSCVDRQSAENAKQAHYNYLETVQLLDLPAVQIVPNWNVVKNSTEVNIVTNATMSAMLTQNGTKNNVNETHALSDVNQHQQLNNTAEHLQQQLKHPTDYFAKQADRQQDPSQHPQPQLFLLPPEPVPLTTVQTDTIQQFQSEHHQSHSFHHPKLSQLPSQSPLQENGVKLRPVLMLTTQHVLPQFQPVLLPTQPVFNQPRLLQQQSIIEQARNNQPHPILLPTQPVSFQKHINAILNETKQQEMLYSGINQQSFIQNRSQNLRIPPSMLFMKNNQETPLISRTNLDTPLIFDNIPFPLMVEPSKSIYMNNIKNGQLLSNSESSQRANNNTHALELVSSSVKNVNANIQSNTDGLLPTVVGKTTPMTSVGIVYDFSKMGPRIDLLPVPEMNSKRVETKSPGNVSITLNHIEKTSQMQISEPGIKNTGSVNGIVMNSVLIKNQNPNSFVSVEPPVQTPETRRVKPVHPAVMSQFHLPGQVDHQQKQKWRNNSTQELFIDQTTKFKVLNNTERYTEYNINEILPQDVLQQKPSLSSKHVSDIEQMVTNMQNAAQETESINKDIGRLNNNNIKKHSPVVFLTKNALSSKHSIAENKLNVNGELVTSVTRDHHELTNVPEYQTSNDIHSSANKPRGTDVSELRSVAFTQLHNNQTSSFGSPGSDLNVLLPKKMVLMPNNGKNHPYSDIIQRLDFLGTSGRRKLSEASQLQPLPTLKRDNFTRKRKSFTSRKSSLPHIAKFSGILNA